MNTVSQNCIKLNQQIDNQAKSTAALVQITNVIKMAFSNDVVTEINTYVEKVLFERPMLPEWSDKTVTGPTSKNVQYNARHDTVKHFTFYECCRLHIRLHIVKSKKKIQYDYI